MCAQDETDDQSIVGLRKTEEQWKAVNRVLSPINIKVQTNETIIRFSPHNAGQ